ncbi:unnamed protein product [Angiostrongylus costaricensis]|uniref:Uncharacterized protein n=1 Tax=Angiostrongylus costaricensis TaxID=334426 RepID=A0A0R3PGF9_ANGCS|nr:unnamed protein product [Angiostrongylus costaricensis]
MCQAEGGPRTWAAEPGERAREASGGIRCQHYTSGQK